MTDYTVGRLGTIFTSVRQCFASSARTHHALRLINDDVIVSVETELSHRFMATLVMDYLPSFDLSFPFRRENQLIILTRPMPAKHLSKSPQDNVSLKQVGRVAIVGGSTLGKNGKMMS